VIRFLYNLLWPIGLVVFLPGYLRKMFRRGGYRRKFGQRLGIYDADVREQLRVSPRIWLHAVSVGEVAIALKLARAIMAVNDTSRFVLTTTTTTGFAFAEKNADPGIEVVYSPLDFWPIMHRAFTVIRPSRIILVEAEVWPNLMALARRRNIPVALVNARLSPRSEKRFRKFRWLVTPLFRQLDLVGVPELSDVDRWSTLGVYPDRIRQTGSIKYDPGEETKGARKQSELVIPELARPVLLGGSTHPGEEEVLARVFLGLRPEFPELLLFLAPRHVERAREIRKQMEQRSLGTKLWSETEIPVPASSDCLVLDRTGELRRCYSIATVVFVGKSLTVTGGQNPVEPILAGKPVVFGPQMQNFATLARELMAAGGAIEVQDETSLAEAVRRLLLDREARQRLVTNGQRIIEAHRGATKRTAYLVLDLKSHR
jgi:3-deoxy-D-manno-octulosonic-acid transferase